MVRRLISLQPRLLIALLVMTLAVRALVPTGFMPTTHADGMIRISLCSGMGPQTVWLDNSGQIHKQAPVRGDHNSQPCEFGVLALGTVAVDGPAFGSTVPYSKIITGNEAYSVAIGRGLAAPPPPSTGPPSLI